MSGRPDISIRKAIANRLLPRHSPFLERLNWSARWNETVRQNADSPVFSSREEMYRYLNANHLDEGRQAMDFLEFGVHLGGSLRFWSELHRHSESRFFGFDSFEGLPEKWNGNAPEGTYSARGRVPEINDQRVQFVVGWFQETLQDFLRSFRPKNRLVIHNDSDLYSSTLYCLTMLDAVMAPGTLIILDEFYDPVHEFRALHDYTCAYRRKYRIVASTREHTQATIQIT